MLKPAKPDAQRGGPIRGEAVSPPTEPARGGAATSGAKAQRRYEVPESDPFGGTANRPHAQTVRGQIQRVRLDLLARENERLDHQLRQLLEQQNESQERDSAWREGWQKHLLDLSQRVDHLVSEAEAARQSEGEQDSGVELRDTVKPLLLAVLEMLDEDERQDRSAAIETARQLASSGPRPAMQPQAAPAAPPPSLPAGLPVDAARVPAAGSAPEASRAPEAGCSTSDKSGLTGDTLSAFQADGPSGDAALESAAAASTTARPLPRDLLPASTARGPGVRNDENETDEGPRAAETPPGDELAIEIARLLLPRDATADSGDLSLVAQEDTWKELESEILQPRSAPRDGVEEPAGILVLGTSETPELAPPPGPPPTAAEDRKEPEIARADPFDDLKKAAPIADQAPPLESEQWDAAIRDVTAAVDLPDADERMAALDTAPVTDASEPDADPDPLPKCLTERWEDTPPDSLLSSVRGMPAQRRDKGSYRWPFRRLRATIDHDHAATNSEPGAGRRRRRISGLGEESE